MQQSVYGIRGRNILHVKTSGTHHFTSFVCFVFLPCIAHPTGNLPKFCIHARMDGWVGWWVDGWTGGRLGTSGSAVGLGPGFDFRCGPWKFSSNLILASAFVSPGFHSASNRNEYQGISLRVKCCRRVELTALTSKLCRMSK